MKQRKWRLIGIFIALLLLCILGGCGARGSILAEANGDTRLCMEVAHYSGSLERTLTIKNTQSGTFSVQLSPVAGAIQVRIVDGNGDTILSMNEQATLTDNAAITNIIQGNGTYQVTVDLKEYTGSFDVSWTVSQ